MEALAPYERQLVQSAKLAAIGELAAGVAHEINNPLFAILALSEFLLKELEPGTKAYERAELIRSTGLEIKEVVRGLLDFARESSDERTLTALDELVRQTVDLVRRTSAKKGITIVERYEGPVLVEASSSQLKQLVLNLLGNAREATPDDGTITVTVRREGADALVTVADSGPGVPDDLRDRIFEPFFTTRRGTGGTGLGLAVSLGIARAHGGTLQLAQGGEGASFVLRLPGL
ncbi:MAG TPA: ATP-binding protein [Gaiellaceae bacterium]|nr:ATP-binding protein [Gaiellaceae bacterium]